MRSPILVLALPMSLWAGSVIPSFTKDIQPIFETNCSGCHASAVKMGSLDLDSYASVMRGGNNGRIVQPGKSVESRLYLMVARKVMPAMPMDGKILPAESVDTIRRWIDGGAPGPAPGEKALPKTSAAAPTITPRRPVHAQIGALAFAPDGKLLAEGTFQEVRFADPVSKTVINEWKGLAEEVRAVAFSPDGKLVAAGGGFPGKKGEIAIWDVAAKNELRRFAGHSDCIYALKFSPDGRTIATSSYDKLIKLWDVTTGEEIRTLKDHIDAIYALAFTPDGKRLISAAADRSVKVWDPATGERLYTMSEATDGLNTVTVDPTGQFVVAGGLDKTIRIWKLEPKAGTLVHSLIAHEDAILQLAWSPDGAVLVSAAADRTLKAFRASDLTELSTFPPQPDWVLSLAFAPDGKSFAAGRFDGSLELYNTPKGEPVR